MIDPWNTKEAELSMTSESPQRFTIPFEVKWSTKINNGGNGDVSIGNGGKNGAVRISKQRTRKSGDSSSSHLRHAQSDSMSSDRLIESSEKKTVCSDRLVMKTDDKTASSDRLVESSEKRKEFNGPDRLIVKLENKTIGPDRTVSSDRMMEKAEKRKDLNGPDRLILKLENKTISSDRTVSSDRMMEKSEKMKDLNGPDRLIVKLENKTISSDRLIEKSEKKKDSSSSDKKARVPDRSTEKSDKKAVTTTSSDRLMENLDETLEGSDVKPHVLIDLKAKNIKLEDTIAVEESESEVKTWNLRPRKPISKNPYVNDGVSPALMQEIKTRPQSPNRARVHADAMIAESKLKKKRLSISLSKEEIVEDVFVMTGSKPARRPKKRPRHVQKQLDFIFPGLWLSSITPDTYKVVENAPKA